jgi:hypothetical protein
MLPLRLLCCGMATTERWIRQEMHHDYSDITNLTDNNPLWYDENGVPRYCAFHPSHLANIYAGEAALVLIECQGCRTEFWVAFSELNQEARLWDPSRQVRVAYQSA